MSFELDGKTIDTDDDGYLTDLDSWTENVANYIADQEGVDMTDAHWEVVNFLRGYYQEYNIAPAIKILIKEMKKMFGPEKGNSAYLYDLYPAGPALQACKIAGLPKPTGCV
jgi:tRNA 2-thiouridine synthesizing protein E